MAETAIAGPDPPDRRCLSVVVPCFNEEATVVAVLERVLASPYTQQVVVVDDASTDRTLQLVRGVADPRLEVIPHRVNQGKGPRYVRGSPAAGPPLSSSRTPISSTTPRSTG